MGFRERESEEGRPPYANDLLLKVVVIRISGAHTVDAGIGAGVPGAPVADLADGVTGAGSQHAVAVLARRTAQALRKVFRAAVKVAAAQGLIGMICHAVDGTKIRAVASRRTTEHREDLEKLLARVEEELAKTEAAVEAAEQERGGRLPVAGGTCRRRRICGRRSGSRWERWRAERAHLHPQEPEARLMPCEGRQDPAYNAQAVADAQAGIVVAAEVVNAESDGSSF